MQTRTITPAIGSRLHPTRLLRLVQACPESVEFVKDFATCAEAWDGTPRADWLLWLLNAFGLRDAIRARLFACWCVRNTPLADGTKVWDLLTDPRSRQAVEVAEQVARGRASEEDRATSWEAAIWAATQAWTSGCDRAHAAATAAAWTLAIDTPAERTAEAAAAAASFELAAKAQADAVRGIFGNPFVSPEAHMVGCVSQEESLKQLACDAEAI